MDHLIRFADDLLTDESWPCILSLWMGMDTFTLQPYISISLSFSLLGLKLLIPAQCWHRRPNIEMVSWPDLSLLLLCEYDVDFIAFLDGSVQHLYKVSTERGPFSAIGHHVSRPHSKGSSVGCHRYLGRRLHIWSMHLTAAFLKTNAL